DTTPRITVTNNDIRAIQMAKAALYAGARLLMDKRGVDKVDRVVLAGAFGAHISAKHAMVLGMIPDVPLEKVSSAGNAAGTGARIALLNRGARGEIEHVVREIEKIETAVEPRFQEHFVAATALPNSADPFPILRAIGGARRSLYGHSISDPCAIGTHRTAQGRVFRKICEPQDQGCRQSVDHRV
ncbi:MAG: ASKHA domain-containing protein, partial [Maritimibacter sp.]